jgi:hypothetical protein
LLAQIEKLGIASERFAGEVTKRPAAVLNVAFAALVLEK